jgi:hypothetical protein
LYLSYYEKGKRKRRNMGRKKEKRQNMKRKSMLKE